MAPANVEMVHETVDLLAGNPLETPAGEVTMTIDYVRFARVLERSAEVAGTVGISASVKRNYDEKVAAAAAEYLAAHRALANAERANEKEKGEGLAALARIDQPFRVARSVAAANLPALAVPPTLKTLDTDTDKRNAIRDLDSLLHDHETEGWAADLIAGDFGTQAATAIREINEWIAASGALQDAQEKRAKAYGPAYERYLPFKEIVRNAEGSSSRHYRRIHIRSNGQIAEDDPHAEAGTGATNTATTAAAAPATASTPKSTS
jgi:hypothetical protein